MATYRACFVGADHSTSEHKDFDAGTDHEAVEIATQWANGQFIEVWREGIFIDLIEMKRG